MSNSFSARELRLLKLTYTAFMISLPVYILNSLHSGSLGLYLGTTALILSTVYIVAVPALTYTAQMSRSTASTSHPALNGTAAPVIALPICRLPSSIAAAIIAALWPTAAILAILQLEWWPRVYGQFWMGIGVTQVVFCFISFFVWSAIAVLSFLEGRSGHIRARRDAPVASVVPLKPSSKASFDSTVL